MSFQFPTTDSQGSCMKEGSGAADKSKIDYTGVDMESIVLNKMSQSERDKHRMITYVEYINIYIHIYMKREHVNNTQR